MKSLLETTTDRRPDAESCEGELLLVAGRGRLFTYALSTDTVTIGRSQECDVVVEDRAFSRKHALLRRRPGLAIQDLGSTNGTRLARGVLRGGEAAPLLPGESFHIGPYSFMVLAGRADDVSSRRGSHERLTVEDPAAGGVSALIREIARSEVNILIQGETGVGKDVLAQSLHALSGRKGTMLGINCAALTETLLESELFGHEKGAFTGAVGARSGLLEAAAGGSAFLDEIGEMPLATQAKLLRAVESREILRLGSTRPTAIDVRFIAATNRDLPAEIAAGRFRKDLFFRLDGVSLLIPPLRERRGMIGPLALRFIGESAQRLGRRAVRAAPEVLAALEAYDWPGNVRELRAVIDRALLLARGAELGLRHLAFSSRADAPPSAPAPAPAPAPVADDDPDVAALLTSEQREERDRLLEALASCAGNQSRAAKVLGISRTTMVTRLRILRVPRPRRGA